MLPALRFLRGEGLERVSREPGDTAATLSGWRDDFLAGGQAAPRCWRNDDRDDEIARLRSEVGELTMDNELHSRPEGHDETILTQHPDQTWGRE